MLRSLLRPTTLAIAASLMLAAPACGKKKDDSSNLPDGKTKEQFEAERAEAAKQAKALGLLDLANQELNAGRFVSARKRAEEALETNPKNADAHAILGAAAWRGGDYAASTEAYKKALELDPANFGAIDGKTANGLVRHSERYDIVAVIDSHKAGLDSGVVLDDKSRASRPISSR